MVVLVETWAERADVCRTLRAQRAVRVEVGTALVVWELGSR